MLSGATWDASGTAPGSALGGHLAGVGSVVLLPEGAVETSTPRREAEAGGELARLPDRSSNAIPSRLRDVPLQKE